MTWLVFSYSLPGQARSSPRVTVWRRLKQLGTVVVAGGAQVLPGREECDEALQWLSQEIRQAGGEAVVMRVAQFQGLSDAELIERFHVARATEYAALEPELKRLERGLHSAERKHLPEAAERLRRRQAALVQSDYFSSPAGARFAARLAQVEQVLAPAKGHKAVSAASIGEYQNKVWVTRPRPHVDRLACAWLIRRHVDPDADIRYSAQAAPGVITFDMEGATFGHQGDLCSFEALLLAFGFDSAGLRALAEIIHDIDLHAHPYRRPEAHGIEAVLSGWRLANLDEAVLEAQGLALFDGLHATLAAKAPPPDPKPVPRRSRQKHP